MAGPDGYSPATATTSDDTTVGVDKSKSKSELSSLPSKRRRTKTGCQRCRIRRRKCDETKPVCRRCADKNLACQYPSGLTFLQKNILTTENQDTGAVSTSNYPRLQFIASSTSPGPGPTRSVPGKRNRMLSLNEGHERSPPANQDECTAVKNRTKGCKQPNSGDSDNQKTQKSNQDSKQQNNNTSTLDTQDDNNNNNNDDAGHFDFDFDLLGQSSWNVNDVSIPLSSPPTNNTNLTPIPVVSSSHTPPNEGLQSALQGLLSLSAGPPNASTSSPLASTAVSEATTSKSTVVTETTQDAGISPGSIDPSLSQPGTSLPAISPSFFVVPPVPAPAPAPAPATNLYNGLRSIPQLNDHIDENAVRLLRHYRYYVAPWLDMCSVHQFFGTAVPRLASASTGLRWALLDLAAASLQLYDGESEAKSGPGNDSEADSFADSSAAPLSALLSSLRDFMTNTPDSWLAVWQRSSVRFMSMLEPYNDITVETMQNISCLFLRLDLAVALLTNTPVHLDDPLIQSTLPSIWAFSEPQAEPGYLAETTSQCTLRILILCAQAVNFCVQTDSQMQPSSSPSASTSPSLPNLAHLPRAQQWSFLTGQLASWYENRPVEFQPMAELDGQDNDHHAKGADALFPVVLFTHGAAVLANQLYHCAMMRLLQHKPRTLALKTASQNHHDPSKKDSSPSMLPLWHMEHMRKKGPSPTMSPLWHAQHICGTALSNNRSECWDPVLLSTLLSAAKAMSYEPQQRRLLRLLGKVERLMHWPMSSVQLQLRREWGWSTEQMGD